MTLLISFSSWIVSSILGGKSLSLTYPPKLAVCSCGSPGKKKTLVRMGILCNLNAQSNAVLGENVKGKKGGRREAGDSKEKREGGKKEGRKRCRATQRHQKCVQTKGLLLLVSLVANDRKQLKLA